MNLIEKTAQKLQAVLSESKLIRWTNQDAVKDSEGDLKPVNVSLLDNVASMAASRVKARVGVNILAEIYEELDDTVGDLVALELSTRQAVLMLSQFFPVTLTEQGLAWVGDLKEDMEAEREARLREVGVAVHGPKPKEQSRRGITGL
jgi:hypothetical protein